LPGGGTIEGDRSDLRILPNSTPRTRFKSNAVESFPKAAQSGEQIRARLGERKIPAGRMHGHVAAVDRSLYCR